MFTSNLPNESKSIRYNILVYTSSSCHKLYSEIARIPPSNKLAFSFGSSLKTLEYITNMYFSLSSSNVAKILERYRRCCYSSSSSNISENNAQVCTLISSHTAVLRLSQIWLYFGCSINDKFKYFLKVYSLGNCSVIFL